MEGRGLMESLVHYIQTLFNHARWGEARRLMEAFLVETRRTNVEVPQRVIQFWAMLERYEEGEAMLTARLATDEDGDPVAEVTSIDGEPFVCLTGLWVHFGADPDHDPLCWYMATADVYSGQSRIWNHRIWAKEDAATSYLSRLGYRMPDLANVIDLDTRRREAAKSPN